MGTNSEVVVLACLAAVAAALFYPWYKDYKSRAQAGERALREIQQFVAESNSLAALGDINMIRRA